MKPKFAVSVEDFAILKEIEGTWQDADHLALLDAMDFGDTRGVDPGDLRDLCLMSLQDLEPDEAAAVVLQYKLGEVLNRGQIDNIANEMLDEKMWEEYSDMALHEQMFTVGSLLYQALPQIFPEPDAVKVKLHVTAIDAADARQLHNPIQEAFLLRLLADGMDGNATLHRLFDEQIRGTQFPEADRVIWIAESEIIDATSADIVVISSGYWLDALRETRSYETAAYPDE